MYKQINLGRVVTGLTLTSMLDGHVLSAGLNGGYHEYYYVKNNDLRKVRFTLNGVLSSDHVSEISFNKLLGMSMSVAGNAKLVPYDLSGSTESTFEEARKQFNDVRCTHQDYMAIYGNRSISLSKFLENLANEFMSDDAAEILNSSTFVVGINHAQFKKLIKGEN
ncbi:hypothetical protein NIGALANA_156 [Bacillus phage Nigalana]|uniref:hypothetical protein n=1 Tax=Bacillus phage Nigalana TaxID=1805951 RepID=UPI0007A776F4|nr:hypothetical protein BI005_gp156 [Bacillus phage Nigalana]AMW61306.1 hypothetical protein NIGALANA_156 [Bacillus phage Nigalana]